MKVVKWMPTIYDVALHAGVSPKTVSRVINESKLVKDETRARVVKAIRDLDFHPNAIAKSLKNQKTNNIGFVVPYGSDFVFRDPGMLEQIKGANDVLADEGYHVILSIPRSDAEVLVKVGELLKHKTVDGLILYAMSGVAPIVREFEEQGLKYASLGKCYAEQKNNYVETDAPYNGFLGAQYLLSLGHRRIGLMAEPAIFLDPVKEGILTGYRQAYQALRLEFSPEWVAEGDYSIEFGYRTTMEWLDRKQPPTAIMSASDPMAWGALRAIRERGLFPGRDIDVLGGDNLPVTAMIEPDLSVIDSKLYDLGARAAALLMDNLRDDREAPGEYFSGELVIRGTTSGLKDSNH